MMKKIGIAPRHMDSNSFVGRFAQCFADGPFAVADFKWQDLLRGTYDIVIFHWPNEFFASRGLRKKLFVAAKLALMIKARFLYKTCFVWVAHNVAPHDDGVKSPLALARFLGQLDGIIYLSEHSRHVINQTYEATKKIPALITRHGHYRELMPTPVTPRPAAPAGPVQLVCFGQIRPYKNIDTLIECAGALPNVDLRVAGMGKDRGLLQKLADMAAKYKNIKLDIRAQPLSDADLEQAIDSGDAVVLPYQTILNSGSAFLALSRNRPVLAPHVGSLPELQAQVGPDWLSLYQGPLTPETIATFAARIGQRAGGEAPNLTAYDWKKIGDELCAFVGSL